MQSEHRGRNPQMLVVPCWIHMGAGANDADDRSIWSSRSKTVPTELQERGLMPQLRYSLLGQISAWSARPA
jgi:hypothetical protein